MKKVFKNVFDFKIWKNFKIKIKNNSNMNKIGNLVIKNLKKFV